MTRDGITCDTIRCVLCSEHEAGELLVEAEVDDGPGVRPARELSDGEPEQRGRNAHETRNWVFLHGTADQFATHTSRMLELHQLARELGLERAALARRYSADPPLLATDKHQDRVITDAGRARLR